ncbi:MAG: hypothetical protein JXB38_01675, partial [Anaerolineales bacterium]|nr:hypothetical protein [Anaerolineales bacterium]
MSRKKSRDKTSLILIGIIVLTILSYVGIYGSKYLPHGDRPEGLSDNPNAMFIDHDALSVEIENIDGGAIRP